MRFSFSFTFCVGVLLLLSNKNCFAQEGEGLMCYSCAYVETGDLDLIDGFGDSPVDDSCKFGGEPKNEFLVECPAVESDPNYVYYQVCAFMRVNGKLRGDNGPAFNGSLWTCATERRERLSPPDTNMLFKECQQGRLADVTRNFRDSTGKEFLQNMSKIFDDTVTSTKFCACDVDACYENEDDNGAGTTEASTDTDAPPGTGSTDDGVTGSTVKDDDNDDEESKGGGSVKRLSFFAIFTTLTVPFITFKSA